MDKRNHRADLHVTFSSSKYDALPKQKPTRYVYYGTRSAAAPIRGKAMDTASSEYEAAVPALRADKVEIIDSERTQNNIISYDIKPSDIKPSESIEITLNDINLNNIIVPNDTVTNSIIPNIIVPNNIIPNNNHLTETSSDETNPRRNRRVGFSGLYYKYIKRMALGGYKRAVRLFMQLMEL